MDRRRALPAADPQGREATIACGAALENLRIAAAHHGQDLEVKACQPRQGESVAIARLVARRPPTPEEERLFHAIPLRRSASMFYPGPLSPEDLGRLTPATRGPALVRRLPRWLARPVAELVAEADAILWSSARFRREVALWTTRGRRPAERAGTSRPQGPAGSGGVLRRLLRLRERTSLEEVERRLDEQTRTLVLLSSPDEGPRDWLEVGRAMQGLLLRATAGGLVSSFLAQPTEVPEVRRRLRREVGEAGHTQVLLRIGYGRMQRPTPRALSQGGRLHGAGGGRRGAGGGDGREPPEARVDRAVLDVVMPRLGGRLVRDRLRAARPGLKALFASGYGEAMLEASFLAQEDIRLIRKPYTREALLRAVRQALDA